MVYPRISTSALSWRRALVQRFAQADSFKKQIEEREEEDSSEEQFRGNLMPDQYAATSKTYDEPASEYYHELYPAPMAENALNPDGDVMRHSSSQRKAQVVDEEKFVTKMSNLLFSLYDRIPWTKVNLTGGDLERTVVTRAELRRWFENSYMDRGALDYIINVASTDRGLSLIGDAFILSGMADQANLGWSKSKGDSDGSAGTRDPVLVLYRQSTGAEEGEASEE
jgi:hypothetical protein